MTTPPPDSGNQNENLLAAIGAFLVAWGGWLFRRNGKSPRPTGVATQADIQSVNSRLDAMQATNAAHFDAIQAALDRHDVKFDTHQIEIRALKSRATTLESAMAE